MVNSGPGGEEEGGEVDEHHGGQLGGRGDEVCNNSSFLIIL